MCEPLKTSPPKWWLLAIAAADQAAPGTAGSLLAKSSDHRRQAVAAALAARQVAHPDDARDPVPTAVDVEFAKALTSGRLDALLAAAYGSCPPGLLGYLKRMKGRIANPATYRLLHEVFASPMHAEAAEALQRVTEPRDVLIDIAMACPAWVLRTGILQTLRTVAHKDALLETIDLILEVCPTANQNAIAASLRGAATRQDLGRFVENWLSRSVFPMPDFDTEGFVHVADAKMLADVARTYRNCALTKRIGILAGTSMMFCCEFGGVAMVVLLRRDDAKSPWEMSELHGHANRKPPYIAYAAATDRLSAAGVRVPRNGSELPSKWGALQDLMNSGFLDDLDDWLPD